MNTSLHMRDTERNLRASLLYGKRAYEVSESAKARVNGDLRTAEVKNNNALESTWELFSIKRTNEERAMLKALFIDALHYAHQLNRFDWRQ